jgi:hypothetical protein
MATLRVEQLGDDLVIRLDAEAGLSLGLRAGDEVHLVRDPFGEVSLAAADMDHQMRAERGRAYLRRLNDPQH